MPRPCFAHASQVSAPHGALTTKGNHAKSAKTNESQSASMKIRSRPGGQRAGKHGAKHSPSSSLAGGPSGGFWAVVGFCFCFAEFGPVRRVLFIIILIKLVDFLCVFHLSSNTLVAPHHFCTFWRVLRTHLTACCGSAGGAISCSIPVDRGPQARVVHDRGSQVIRRDTPLSSWREIPWISGENKQQAKPRLCSSC